MTESAAGRRKSLGELVLLRQEIMEPFWRIQESAQGVAPLTGAVAMAAVVTTEALRELIADWETTPNAMANSLETGRLFRYFGDVLSASGSQDNAVLGEALAAYGRSGTVLRNATEPRELGNLLFNLAATLRRVARGHNRDAMEQARRNYCEARHLFLREVPERVTWVDVELEALDVELRACSAAPRSHSSEIDEVRTMLDAEIARGDVLPEHAVTYHRMLDKLQSTLLATEQGSITSADANSRVRQLYGELEEHVATPKSAIQQSDSVMARTIDDYAGRLKVTIGRQLVSNPPPATREALTAMLGDVLRVQTELRSDTSAAALVALEANLLRRVAANVHALAMTRHAIAARPLWNCADYALAVNSIFYSGGSDLSASLQRVATSKRMRVESPPLSQNHAQSRWDALNRCQVAVFDLRGCNRNGSRRVTADQTRATEIALAAYELGLAFATGRSVVVVSGVDDALPFDIDITPLTVDRDITMAESELGTAIDDALYTQQRPATISSLPATLAQLDRLTAGHQQRLGFEKMGWFHRDVADDPAGFVAVAEQILRALPRSGLHMLRPVWPGAYPDDGDRRCFHVMPFGPGWANEVRESVRRVCTDSGFQYRRGDEAREHRIMDAIWDDICRAHLVLVDLTDGNLNVLIELAFAHALGREVLLVRRRGDASARVPSLGKLRTHEYNSLSDLTELLRDRLCAQSKETAQ